MITGAELEKFFGKEATPRQMKDQIMTRPEDWQRAAAALSLPSRQENGYGKVTTSGHHDQRLFAAPISRLFGLTPSPPRIRAQAGVGCQGGFAPPCAAALPLTACPGCAFSPASGGGYILQSRPLFQDWKGAGKKVDHYIIKMEVFKMKRPLAYYCRAERPSPARRRSRPPSIAVPLMRRAFRPTAPRSSAAFPEDCGVSRGTGIDMGRDLLRRSTCWWCAADISTGKA